MTARKWVLKCHFAGVPKREDLELVEETLPALGDEGMNIQKWSRGYAKLIITFQWLPYV